MDNVKDQLDSTNRGKVAVVGGGLAGIAAASALVRHGVADVFLFEARQQLGGRAGSYLDQETQERIDNCQHVNMHCGTNFRQLCAHLDIADRFQTQKELHFVSPDGQVSPFREGWLPAPLHLSQAFLRLPYLTLNEKMRFAQGVRALARSSTEQLVGVSFKEWLLSHGQTEQLIRRVWEVVLVSALSETLDRIDAAYARKVFVDGFLANREGWRVDIPDLSLDELYATRGAGVLQSQGVTIRLNSRLKSISISEGHVSSLTFTEGESFEVDQLVLAIPQHQVSKVLAGIPQLDETLSKLDQIETAPISSVHLWLDRKICDLPHAVFVDRFSQWMFSRTHNSSSSNYESHAGHYYQIVISASRNLDEMSREQVINDVLKDLTDVWPEAKDAKLLHSKIISERRAVFSVTPGIDALRPAQQSSLDNLQLAGDWTQTGWPATMEGAVRSGYLAAGNILKKYGVDDSPLAADLPTAAFTKWLF